LRGLVPDTNAYLFYIILSPSNIADLRQEYSSQGLEETKLPKSPFKLFDQWLDDAIRAQVKKYKKETL